MYTYNTYTYTLVVLYTPLQVYFYRQSYSCTYTLYAYTPYIQQHHQEAEAAALSLFDEIAGLGSESNIESYREKVYQQIQNEWLRYKETNRLRNPYRDIERYILPVAVTGGFWLIATLLDLWCTSDQCEVCISVLYMYILEYVCKRVVVYTMMLCILLYCVCMFISGVDVYAIHSHPTVLSFFIITIHIY